jgi:hypothetical protein
MGRGSQVTFLFLYGRITVGAVDRSFTRGFERPGKTTLIAASAATAGKAHLTRRRGVADASEVSYR